MIFNLFLLISIIFTFKIDVFMFRFPNKRNILIVKQKLANRTLHRTSALWKILVTVP